MKILETINIPLSKIVPDKNQPRKYFGAEKLARLRKSIIANGILTPLTVEKVGNNYLLVDGERRFRVASDLKLKDAPCIVMEPQSIAQRLIQQYHIQEMHEGWTGTEKAMAVWNLSKEMGVDILEICKLLELPLSTARTYIGFAELLDKRHFERSELDMQWARQVTNLRLFVKKIYQTVNKETFTTEMGKDFERNVINRIKNGSIQNSKDFSKIRDSVKADADIIQKMIKSNISTDEMVTETHAEIPRFIAQMNANTGFIGTMIDRLLVKKGVKLKRSYANRLKHVAGKIKDFLEHVEIIED